MKGRGPVYLSILRGGPECPAAPALVGEGRGASRFLRWSRACVVSGGVAAARSWNTGTDPNPLNLRTSYVAVVESFISKVTSAGQLTLPSKIRKALGLKGSEYVEVALLGQAVVIRRLREEDEVLETIRRKVKKSGLTRARLQQLVDEARRTTWKKRYREAVR